MDHASRTLQAWDDELIGQTMEVVDWEEMRLAA
jgi:hypothetical protein